MYRCQCTHSVQLLTRTLALTTGSPVNTASLLHLALNQCKWWSGDAAPSFDWHWHFKRLGGVTMAILNDHRSAFIVEKIFLTICHPRNTVLLIETVVTVTIMIVWRALSLRRENVLIFAIHSCICTLRQSRPVCASTHGM